MDRFPLRRAIERLRGGLFDPVAVNQLTVEEHQIKAVFSKNLQATGKHLCLCGSYGQGKSHTINYLNQYALSQGYATSVVQLDLREVPFHQFSIVYQFIMERLSLPDGKKFTQAWKAWAEKNSIEFLNTMPHRLKMILTAMLCKSKRLSSEEIALKKHQNYRPKEYGVWLEKALMGCNIPTAHLKSVFKYRDVEGYREQSLSCSGNDFWVHMVQCLGKVLKEIGYKGLVLFFDEAESIAFVRLNHRAKSYQVLDQFFRGSDALFPVFAFTDDFFHRVNHEPYDANVETFPKNYAEAWKNLNIFRLQDFSSHGWESLLDRLMQLYSRAYQINLPSQIKDGLQSLLLHLESQETRYKLKALVNKLDVETQHILLNQQNLPSHCINVKTGS